MGPPNKKCLLILPQEGSGHTMVGIPHWKAYVKRQPLFGDQLVNARYVSHIWRVGLHLEKRLERWEIERAIRRVILEADGQEIRDRIIQLKEKVDVSLRQGGSSYQSLERLIRYIDSF
ncbi:hypothetical protein Patl1_06496 [Pistacia atlantica]|uniref:Uncharacterized protein n=1 Tax=Pistacia atlantica TaxID=434234 RepID=A0ACC1BVF4_9ROSI|nr:hypothetical protein Patl1_06496 [Pistacia atlantica]